MSMESLLVHVGEASVRALLLAVPAGIASRFLRRNAHAQHAVWTAVLAGMLLLPAVSSIPQTRVPVRSTPALEMLSGIGSVEYVPPVSTAAPSVIPAPPRRPWLSIAAALYAMGFGLLAIRLLVGVAITQRIVRRAVPVDLIARGPVSESREVRVPVTAGFVFPRIVLPIDWREWDVTVRDTVLAHESAHVRRRDGLVNLLAAMNVCIFWFHPLAWWLERHLAVLAEHAADDVAMEVCGNPKQYARTLLSMASSMNGHRQRLVWSGVSMRGGRVTERIRRVLAADFPRFEQRLNRGVLAAIWSGAAVVVWLAGALQIESPARAQTAVRYGVEGQPQWGFRSESLDYVVPGEVQVAELGRKHASNPDDEAVVNQLLAFYWHTHREEERAQLIWWMIDHHPGSELHRKIIGSFFPLKPTSNRANYDEAIRRWQVQMARHPNDPQVLGNAARALGETDLKAEIELMQRAYSLDPVTWTFTLSVLYEWVLNAEAPGDSSAYHNPALAAQIREWLENSRDATLILAMVQNMVQRAAGEPGTDVARAKATAGHYLDIVEDLEPGSQRVVGLREGVRLLGVSYPVTHGAPAPVLRIAGAAAARNLLIAPRAVRPVYATGRRIQGHVTLQVRIGATVFVEESMVISGDPPLTDAAVAAVQHYVYQPPIVKGQACAVVTTVEFEFRD